MLIFACGIRSLENDGQPAEGCLYLEYDWERNAAEQLQTQVAAADKEIRGATIRIMEHGGRIGIGRHAAQGPRARLPARGIEVADGDELEALGMGEQAPGVTLAPRAAADDDGSIPPHGARVAQSRHESKRGPRAIEEYERKARRWRPGRGRPQPRAWTAARNSSSLG